MNVPPGDPLHARRVATAPGPRLADALAAVAAGLYLFIATFPEPSYTGPSLDGSCRYEVSRLAAARLFGSDAAYTYGPLGWLLTPMDSLHDVTGAAGLRIALQLVLALAVGNEVLRRRWLAAFVLIAAQLAASATGLLFEYRLLLVVPWLLTRDSALALPLAAALGGAGLFVKTTLGVGALGMTVVAMGLVWLRDRKRAYPSILAAAVALAGTMVLLGVTQLRSLRELPAWLSLSLRIADGFSEAMSFPGRHDTLALGVGTVAAWGAATLALLRGGGRAGRMALVFAPAVFLAYKHAFVRHDIWHEVGFFPFVLAALGFVLAETRTRVEAALVGAVLAITLAGTPGLLRYTGNGRPAALWHLVNGGHGRHNAGLWTDLAGETRRQHEFAERAMLPDHVPGLAERVAGRTVGIIPWELTLCRANGLSCLPSPTLQLFSAYTADLDERSARHFAAAEGPQVVLFSTSAIDGRSVVLDTPATLRVVLERYAPAAATVAGPEPYLLDRRAAPAPLRMTGLGTSLAVPGRWIRAPRTGGLLFAGIDLDLSLRGRITKLLFRIDPVYLDVAGCDGRHASIRVLPDTARHGLLLTNAAAGVAGVGSTLLRRIGSAVCAIRISGPGLGAYRAPIPVHWSEAPGEGSAPEEPSEPPGAVDVLRAPDAAPGLRVEQIALEPLEDGSRLLVLRGWAVDPLARKGAAGILVEVDGRPAWVPTREARPDVADVLGVPGYERSGFDAALNLGALGPGEHELVLRVVSFDRRGAYPPERRNLQVR